MAPAGVVFLRTASTAASLTGNNVPVPVTFCASSVRQLVAVRKLCKVGLCHAVVVPAKSAVSAYCAASQENIIRYLVSGTLGISKFGCTWRP